MFIIGDNACIAAQTGISGSVKIGKNLIYWWSSLVLLVI